MNRILVTGGAGYIGSHTCVELLNAGYSVVIFDNFSNSHEESINRITQITGKSPTVVRGDIRDKASLENALRKHECTAVIHFAGLKSAGESVEKPLDYYDNNVIGTYRLITAMKKCGVKILVFSSSAAVYGEPQFLPLTENHPLSAINPYGRTKLVIEEMLRDLFRAEPDWRIGILRYFNPVGAHESGLIGEDPQGIPDNLMPIIAQVAVGRRPKVNIFGDDYSTPDGTGIRDYIHVVDLAAGHLKALERLSEPRCFSVNLGTGRGYSVLEVIHAFKHASARPVPFAFMPRRPGDAAVSYADPSLAAELLGWRATRNLETMCIDHWRWQQKNPAGLQ
jgi:UDP-glucose 4-epimerase